MSSNYSNEFHLPIDYYLLNCSSRVSPRRIKLNRIQQQISCPQQQQQTYRQTQIAQQVPLNQVSPTPQQLQIAQQVPLNQVSSAPRQLQIAQQVPLNQVSPTPQQIQIAQQVPSGKVSSAPRWPQIVQQESSRKVSSDPQLSPRTRQRESPRKVFSAPPRLSPQITPQESSNKVSYAPQLSPQITPQESYDPFVELVNSELSFDIIRSFNEIIEEAKTNGMFSNDIVKGNFEQILKEQWKKFIEALKAQIAEFDPVKNF